MHKTISRFLIAILLVMPVLVASGCGDSNSVEIPTNPDKKSPGRPAANDMGDGGGSAANEPESPPPAEAPE